MEKLWYFGKNYGTVENEKTIANYSFLYYFLLECRPAQEVPIRKFGSTTACTKIRGIAIPTILRLTPLRGCRFEVRRRRRTFERTLIGGTRLVISFRKLARVTGSQLVMMNNLYISAVLNSTHPI